MDDTERLIEALRAACGALDNAVNVAEDSEPAIALMLSDVQDTLNGIYSELSE